MGIIGVLFGKSVEAALAPKAKAAKLAAPAAAPASAKVENKPAPKAESKPAAPAKAEKKSKPFYLDADYLAVAVIFILVLFSAKAFAVGITVPENVVVSDTNVFYADLVNDSDSGVNIKVNFYSPVQAGEVVAPAQLVAHSTGRAKITVHNNLSQAEDVSATLEVTVGKEVTQKEVTLSLKPSQTDMVAGAVSGLFSFGAFLEETSGFGALDWVVFFVLVVIAAVLLVAFVARMVRK